MKTSRIRIRHGEYHPPHGSIGGRGRIDGSQPPSALSEIVDVAAHDVGKDEVEHRGPVLRVEFQGPLEIAPHTVEPAFLSPVSEVEAVLTQEVPEKGAIGLDSERFFISSDALSPCVPIRIIGTESGTKVDQVALAQSLSMTPREWE